MVKIATHDGIDPAIAGDPRWSQAQREAAIKVARADAEATVMGLDAKLRPVIRARLGTPPRVVTYALLRNGNPTAITRPIAERWGTTKNHRRSS